MMDRDGYQASSTDSSWTGVEWMARVLSQQVCNWATNACVLFLVSIYQTATYKPSLLNFFKTLHGKQKHARATHMATE
jgi:hypothetical protein